MNLKTENIILAVFCTLLLGTLGVLLVLNNNKRDKIKELETVEWNTYTYTYAYEIVDAKRIIDENNDSFIYKVGLKDQDGYYFSIQQDLVTFAAMGVNVNEILIKGEE